MTAKIRDMVREDWCLADLRDLVDSVADWGPYSKVSFGYSDPEHHKGTIAVEKARTR